MADRIAEARHGHDPATGHTCTVRLTDEPGIVGTATGATRWEAYRNAEADLAAKLLTIRGRVETPK
jgi:hypothetical protein